MTPPVKEVAREGGKEKDPEARREGKAGGGDAGIFDDFIDKGVCPKCEAKELVRVRRRRWMRLFPQSQHCRCLECRARFFMVGRLKIKLGQAKK